MSSVSVSYKIRQE